MVINCLLVIDWMGARGKKGRATWLELNSSLDGSLLLTEPFRPPRASYFVDFHQKSKGGCKRVEIPYSFLV